MQEDLDLLADTGGDPGSIKLLALALRRTERSVSERYNRMKLESAGPKRTNARGPMQRWAQEEIDWLRVNYAQASAEELTAKFPNRRLLAVRCRASEMGLTLPRAVATKLAQQRAEAGSLGPNACNTLNVASPAEAGSINQALSLDDFDPKTSCLKDWTLEQMQELMHLLAMRSSNPAIRAQLNKTQGQLRKATLYLGVSMEPHTPWRNDHEALLIRTFRKGGLGKCVERLAGIKSHVDVCRQLAIVGEVANKPIAWRPWEVQYLLHSMRVNRHADEVAQNLEISRELVLSKVDEFSRMTSYEFEW